MTCFSVFFGSDDGLDPEFFDQWEKCVKTWINEEVDSTLENEIDSDLKTIARQAYLINRFLEDVDQVDEGLYIDIMHELSLLKTAAEDIKTMVCVTR